MSLFYKIAYRLGITPWEKAAETHGHLIEALIDREEAGREPPFGSVLDLGCGSGHWTIGLAKRGWQAVGVDNVEKALSTARANANATGARARFVNGDVTALREADLGAGFNMFLDLGCFHGLNDEQRLAMAREVSDLAAPGAILLELVWAPGKRGPLPRGASREDLEMTFDQWDIVGEDPLDSSGLPGFLKNADPRVYRLRRISG